MRTGPAGDNAGAFGRGLQQNLRGAVTSNHLVRDGGALQVELDQVFLGLLDSLLDGHGHFTGFAHAEAGMPMAVANHHERGEAEVLAALDDLRDAVDGDDVILQVRRIDFQQPPNR